MVFDRDVYARRRARQLNLVRVETMYAAASTKVEIRRIILRALMRDNHVKIFTKLAAGQRLRAIEAMARPLKFNRRCRISGRPRQVIRTFGFARMHLRQQFHERLIPTVVQKRW
jgi:small subunit ribosomal protein S14